MIKAAIFDMYETLITLFSSPAYFSAQMAVDAGIPEDVFIAAWRTTEDDRTLGRVTVDDVVAQILKANNCYSKEMIRKIMGKRIAYKKEAFIHMHSEIIPMMEELKKQGLKIALISNCHSEEAMAIKESILYPYFNTVCLSYDIGVKKPDQAIFRMCLDGLGLNADECIYIGDGGSNELEAAKTIGMHPVQSVWYLKEGTSQPSKRMSEYIQAETPMAITELVSLLNQST